MTTKPVFFVLSFTMLLAFPAASRTPTNDAAAFKTFDLYADRTSSGNTSDHFAPAGYPSWLGSPPLLMVMRPTPGSPDTMALFNSFAKNSIYFEVNANQPESFSTYAVSPPQYATSLGSLFEGVLVCNGTAQWADFGKPLNRATVTYVDGDTAVVTLHVGYHIREYLDSGFSCNFVNIPLYTTRPSDPLSAYLYEQSSYYFDAQESLLPTAKRAKRVASIRIDGILLDHFCSVYVPHTYAASLFSGLSIWPHFSVVNATAQPVVRQSQFTNVDHGGYIFGGIPVGTRRLMNQTACQVASQAMCYTYAGFDCTASGFNAYLQQNKGYEPDQVAIVGTVSGGGSSITFTATGKTVLKVNDAFVVVHGTFTNPLATYRVTVQYQRQPYVAGQAARIATHSATVPSENDPGRVYWKMKPRVADGFTTSPQLRSIDLSDSPQLAAQVESLLVRDIAVQVNVPDHFVVAHGWTSSFRPDGSASGTYFIRDPFDTRNYSKLIEGKYRNTFTMARYVVPIGTLVAGMEGTAGVDPPGLAILASGAYRVEVIDPLGRRMLRDAGTGEGVYEIPDAAIEDISSEHDNGGDVDDPLTGYDVEIPTTVDGHYTVNVFAQDGLSLSANGYTSAGIFASDGAVDTTAGAVRNSYDVLYSGAGQSVSVTHVGTTGVNEIPRPTGPSLLRVRRSPTTGPVEFIAAPTGIMDDAIEVFDITGRKIDAVRVTTGSSAQTITWDWRAAGARPGVYLARLRSSNAMTRFVILD
jgi:hypothetical protein